MKSNKFSIFVYLNKILWIIYLIEIYILGAYFGLCLIWILFSAIIEPNTYLVYASSVVTAVTFLST